jgi:hypothetical protein
MFDDSDEDFTIKKGRIYYSLTFSLDQRKAENEDQLLRQVIDQNKYDYRIIGECWLCDKRQYYSWSCRRLWEA